MRLYDRIGFGYAAHRRADPRIAAAIEAALGDAVTVVNVGAGTGSYESNSRRVIAVEPSPVMIAQRSAGAAPVVQSVAEAIPFASRSFDAATAILTIQHWSDKARGLAELKRVARRQVILTADIDVLAERLWIVRDYFRLLVDVDRMRFVSPAVIADAVGATVVEAVPIPSDCRDGFLGAYWSRPEAYLDPKVLAAISVMAILPDDERESGLARLRADLTDGTWDERYGHLRNRQQMDVGFRLVH